MERRFPGLYSDAGDERYNGVAIAFHWTIAVLVLANLPLGLLHDWIERNLDYSAMWIHKSIGLTVLVLTIGRIGWRLAHRPPPLPPGFARWEAAAAATVHISFYVVLLALPITGLVRSSGGPYPLTWFGLFDVPKLPVTEDGAADRLASALHDRLGWLMLGLAVLHIAAAVRHRFWLKDKVLERMLPGRRGIV